MSINKIYKNLISGKKYENIDLKYIEIKSPIDGSLVGKIQAMRKDDVNYAIMNAKEAQKSWKNTPLNERAHILYKVANLLGEEKEILVETMIREVAKDRKGAESEIERTIDYIRYTADVAKSMEGESIPSDNFPGFRRNKISLVTRVPLGVVLAISPFNYPVNLSASKIAPAIVAGNTVVLKPATQGSISALILANIFIKAGLPAGVLNTVTGRGSDIGDYCVSHENIDFVNFTGSTEVGKRISQLTIMKPLLLELGGKDAAIILEDANIDLVVDNIISGGYSYSGQRCTAVKRVLVQENIANELVKKLKDKIKTLKMGNPLTTQVDIVPLIDSKSADFVMDLIDDAKEKGATLISGGKRQGNFIEPTLFDYVTLDMRLAWEEPFGPVLPIIRVKDIDMAIDIANKSEYGLQSSIFTNDINKAFYVADRLEVGTVQVNNKTERGPDHFPFLGVKASGLGTQGVRYSIEAMSRLKCTVININNK
ncbi:MAG: NADP-dependent glyceraldehyde-3-phosphate dehydrogenase [Sarcina sp.]